MLKLAKPETGATESVFKPTMVLMCGRTVSFAATFLIPVLLARIFAPAEFGTYKQVFLVYATVYGIAQFGMAESLFYFLPRDPRNGGRYVLNAVLILLLAGLASLGLLVSQAEHIAMWLNNSSLAAYIPLLSANLVFMVASAPLEIALVSRKRYRWAAYVYGSDVVRVAFLLVPVVIWHDLRYLLIGGIIFAVLRFCAALFYFRVEFESTLSVDCPLLRNQFAYALPFELAVLVETAQSNFHNFAVSHYFNAATFAIYSVGCLQIPLIEFLASPAGNVMMVLMSEKISQGSNQAVVSLWHDTTRKLSLIFFPLIALLIVTARDLIPFLFTEQYRASVPIFMIWTATILFSVLQTDAVLRVFAATRFLLILNTVRLFIVAGLIYVFVSRFGIIGAVLATVLAMATSKAMALAKIKNLFSVPVSSLLPWRTLAVTAAISVLACVGPLMVHQVLDIPAFPRLALSGTAYAVLYCAFLWRFGVLNESEKAELTGWLKVSVPAGIEVKTVRELSES